MSNYFSRVRLTMPDGTEHICWEKVEDDNVVGYIADDQSVITEPDPTLVISYVSQAMVEDPFAPPAQ
jgi:hypothetical protein